MRDGRPSNCAAPSTTIASDVLASSRREANHTWTNVTERYTNKIAKHTAATCNAIRITRLTGTMGRLRAPLPFGRFAVVSQLGASGAQSAERRLAPKHRDRFEQRRSRRSTLDRRVDDAHGRARLDV